MASAKKSVDDLSKADVKKPSQAFEDFSNKAAIAGAVVAVGVGKAIKSFADFDAQMSAVSAALPDAGAQMDSLRKLAVDLGQDTQFSATEAAAGITEMAKAGVGASDILNGGLAGGLDLAAAGQLDVARASEIAATALNQFGLKGSDVAHVADLYAAAAGKAQGSVEDIAQAMKFAGVTANSMGVSIEETTGVIGLFASKGIIGEQAGTSFRSMLVSLTSPSAKAAETMEGLGISVYDASGNFIGMQATASELQRTLGPLDEATRNAALGQIFGNESLNAAIALYQGGGTAVADWTQKVNDAGFAQEQAAKLTDNLKGDIERLSGSIETVFIQAGSGANDMLRSLAQGAGAFVDFLGRIPGPMLLLGSALGSLALLGPKALLSFRQWHSDLDTLGLSMDKITTKAPRLGRALGVVNKALVGLAVAAAAGTATNLLTTIADLDLDSKKLEAGGDALAYINEQMRNTSDLGAPVVGTLDDFRGVIDATFNPTAYQNVDNFFQTLNSSLGFENASNIEVASQRIGQVDAALAKLVTSGRGEAAATAFNQLATAAAAQGVTLDQLKAKFPEYADAIDAVGAASASSGDDIDGMSANVRNVKDDAEDAKAALDDLTATIEGFGSPLASQRAAQRDFNSAVIEANDAIKAQRDEFAKSYLESKKIDPEKASKKQLAAAQAFADAQIKSGKALDTSTKAGIALQGSLDSIRDRTIKNVVETFKLTNSTELAAEAMQEGRDAFIAAEIAAGRSAEEAAILADNLGLIPKDVETQIALAGVPTAKAELDDVTGQMDVLDKKTAKPAVKPFVDKTTADATEARLDQLARQRNAFISVSMGITSGVGSIAATIKGLGGSLFADGGYTGAGGKYDPAGIVHRGEVVWSQADIRRWGGVHVVESMRTSPGYADGGVVGRAAAASVGGFGGLSGSDIALLLQAVNRPRNQIDVRTGDPITAARLVKADLDWEAANG